MTSAPTPSAAAPQPEPAGQQISPKLRAFVGEYPWERGTILDFMLRAASELSPGARVLDVGAGEAPYSELFAHIDYRTSDWERSVHPGARNADYIGSADDLPIGDGEFDAVLNTGPGTRRRAFSSPQSSPRSAMRRRRHGELYRVLGPGGRLHVSVPLVWELHDEPYDFYRYTPRGLRYLAQQAGSIKLDIRPRNDTFTTLAQLLRHAGSVMGRQADGLDQMRQVAAQTLRQLSDLVAGYAALDVLLGYTLTAVRPTQVPNARRVAVAALASEILEAPDLLEAYAQQFSGADAVTLVVLANDYEIPRMVRRVERLGYADDDAADLLAVAPQSVGRDSIDGLYSRLAWAGPSGSFAAL